MESVRRKGCFDRKGEFFEIREQVSRTMSALLCLLCLLCLPVYLHREYLPCQIPILLACLPYLGHLGHLGHLLRLPFL